MSVRAFFTSGSEGSILTEESEGALPLRLRDFPAPVLFQMPCENIQPSCGPVLVLSPIFQWAGKSFCVSTYASPFARIPLSGFPDDDSVVAGCAGTALCCRLPPFRRHCRHLKRSELRCRLFQEEFQQNKQGRDVVEPMPHDVAL